MAGIFCLGNNKSVTKQEGIGKTSGEDLNGTCKCFLLNRGKYCVCIFVGERKMLSKIHTFFRAGRITVFTPENVQVTDKVVLKETLS